MNDSSFNTGESMKTLLQDAISAVQGGIKAGEDTAEDIEKSATHPALKDQLQHGAEVSRQWKQRFEDAAQQIGTHQGSPAENPIMAAIYETGMKITEQAEDSNSRDLGIIATGQIALHYFIASFGTLAAYTQRMGMSDLASKMEACLDEAKDGDERMSEVAKQIA